MGSDKQARISDGLSARNSNHNNDFSSSALEFSMNETPQRLSLIKYVIPTLHPSIRWGHVIPVSSSPTTSKVGSIAVHCERKPISSVFSLAYGPFRCLSSHDLFEACRIVHDEGSVGQVQSTDCGIWTV